MITNGPIVILTLDWIGKRLSLRVALNASVTGRYVIHVRRIKDVTACGMRHVFTTGAVAAFAAHIPLSYLLGVNVIANRVAPVAERPRWTVHVVEWIEGSPPVPSGLRHLVLAPFLIDDFPLHRQREIVVADLREVSLFPDAPVDESNLIFGELVHVVRCEVRNDCIGMLARVADNVRHRRFLPTLIDFRVALFTSLRPDVVRRSGSSRLLNLLLLC